MIEELRRIRDFFLSADFGWCKIREPQREEIKKIYPEKEDIPYCIEKGLKAVEEVLKKGDTK